VTRSLSRWQAVLLGLVVLLVLGGTVAGLFAVGSRYAPWNDTFDLRVGFQQIRGVEPGTRVRVQGVDAGEVIAVDPPAEPGGNVMLTLRLDHGRLRSRTLLRADAKAQIASEGMVGGKVIEIHPGTAAASPVGSGAEIASEPTLELNDALAQAGKVLGALEEQKGKVGELVDNTNKLIVRGHDAVSSIQRVSEAVEAAPLVNGYVKDPQKLLYPPNSERNDWWFRDADLFEAGTDRLTEGGRTKLDALAEQIGGLTRHDGAELVVVAWTEKKVGDASAARRLTDNQSETVRRHLKDRGAVYKSYWLFSRKATALGFGAEKPPVPEKDRLAPAGVGVLVFIPQT
jgi:phospholipid/cholesterol/gamma-HCH transport system substrate-binding protein